MVLCSIWIDYWYRYKKNILFTLLWFSITTILPISVWLLRNYLLTGTVSSYFTIMQEESNLKTFYWHIKVFLLRL